MLIELFKTRIRNCSSRSGVLVQCGSGSQCGAAVDVILMQKLRTTNRFLIATDKPSQALTGHVIGDDIEEIKDLATHASALRKFGGTRKK